MITLTNQFKSDAKSKEDKVKVTNFKQDRRWNAEKPSATLDP